MSTVQILKIVSLDSDATSAIGEKLGHNAHGSEVFLLVSDLGGGKTTLVKGLARGLGSKDQVGSPSFTLNRQYNCRGGLCLQHFDFYRLHEAGVLGQELDEFLNDEKTVVAIEWGDIVRGNLPSKRLEITIEKTAEDENKRNISLVFPPELSYLIKGIK